MKLRLCTAKGDYWGIFWVCVCVGGGGSAQSTKPGVEANEILDATLRREVFTKVSTTLFSWNPALFQLFIADDVDFLIWLIKLG